ncbi:hypothetical protein TWF696_003770 [Orbilia brochopaga]|uniref:Uncharacterized protein n=1 Tax=Orbilia brochopaga TaxID=3140254 RepID=A0AAV9V4Z3_9PEZI
MSVECSRRDPPSPPRPPRPPPPTPEPQKRMHMHSITNTIRPTSRSRQDPPSPPRAPPPSPTKHASKFTPRTPLSKRQLFAVDPPASPESFPRLLELTMALGNALDMPVLGGGQSYFYCEDDMSVPGSPPPLSFTPPRRTVCEDKSKKRKARRRAESDVSECASPDESTKRRRTIINLDDSLLFLPDGPQDDFGSFLMASSDAGMLHERMHRIRGCA